MLLLFWSLLWDLSNIDRLALFVGANFVNWIKRIRFDSSHLSDSFSGRTKFAHCRFFIDFQFIVVFDHGSFYVVTAYMISCSVLFASARRFGPFDILHINSIPNKPICRFWSKILKFSLVSKRILFFEMLKWIPWTISFELVNWNCTGSAHNVLCTKRKWLSFCFTIMLFR